MKTTIDLDERKLRNVMKLKGLKTRKAAIDYALTEAERRAKLEELLKDRFYISEGPVVEAGYDIRKLRDADGVVYARRSHR